MTREKAIKIIKEFISGTCLHTVDQDALETLIPELKENEDERIRKALIEALKTSKTVGELKFVLPEPTREECIAYLEKQKELDKMIVVSPEVWDNAISDAYENGKKDNEKQKENPEEPKIAFGDWGDKEKQEAIFTCLKYMRFIKKITNQEYNDLTEWLGSNLVYNLLGNGWYLKQKEQKPVEWSKKDEEMLKSIIEDITPVGECPDYPTDEEREYYYSGQDKMNWLKGLSNRFNLQPKSEWSEDDVKRIKQLIYDTEHIRAEYKKRKEIVDSNFNDSLIKDCDEQITWLNNLLADCKRRNADIAKLCSNEWSKEDEETIGTLINYFEGDALDYSTDEMVRRIKALRPSWKPSEEQMEALLNIEGDLRAFQYNDKAKIIAELYEQLKRL